MPEIELLKKELIEIGNFGKKYWQQRARGGWLKGGDRNTRWFHPRAFQKKKSNEIESLMDDDDSVIADQNGITFLTETFFRDLFTSGNSQSGYMAPILEVMDNKVSPSLLENFDSNFIREIYKALFDMSPLKALGPDEMLKETVVVLLIGLEAWAYQASYPPPPKICGSQGGPPITAPRIKLRDGRHLAYVENGVSRETAKYKIISVHGFSSFRHGISTLTKISAELVEELGVYFVSFDRPGYGQSDPDPNRTPKSSALDIEELADHLELGSKFFVIGFSMGGQAVWGCLKYIPHRLAGVALLAPVVNYWWSGFPANLSKEAYYLQLPEDQWTLRIAHYTPYLTYWWNTQKFFPTSTVAARKPQVFSKQDLQLLSMVGSQISKPEATQQGEFESLHRDMMIGFGKWEFDPMDLKNPFAENEGTVHLWQGDEDKIVPVSLQRYIAQKLPWIHYHELPSAGHLLDYMPAMIEAILKALLFGEK